MAVAFSLARDSLQAHEPQARLLRFRRHGYQRFVHLRSQINFHYFWERRWFFITLLVGFAILLAPTPSGLTEQGQIVLAMSADGDAPVHHRAGAAADRSPAHHRRPGGAAEGSIRTRWPRA